MAQRHPLQKILSPLLLPCSFAYAAGIRLRRRLYQKGVLPSWIPSAPCVSVGNISWGGTGKSPLVDWLLSWAGVRDLRVAVLTRGYGAHPPHPAFKVRHDSSPAECGDEPLMLFKKHPESLVIVDPDRSRGGKSISPPPDLFLLDDGFQHLGTARDADLVLLDRGDVLDMGEKRWNRIIPAGTWREPESALHYADAFLIKADPDDEKLAEALKKRLNGLAPVFGFRMFPVGLRPVSSSIAPPEEKIAGPFAFVCGLGNPHQALATAVRFMGREPSRTLFLPDHHDFRNERKKLEELGLPIICTEKDADKLFALKLDCPIFALVTELRFFSFGDTEEFPQWWEKLWLRLQEK